jgi:hypothetical protein
MENYVFSGVTINMAGSVSNATATVPKKKPFRFSAAQDILLLREVVAVNPYAAKDAGRLWMQIAERLQDLGMQLEGRRCRERTALLLDYYRKEDKERLRRY